MLYVVVVVSCGDCGSKTAIGVFDHVATKEEEAAIHSELGGMWCAQCTTTHVDVEDLEESGPPGRRGMIRKGDSA